MSTAPIGPILNPLDQIEIVTDAWLWPGRIPLGAITTLVGYGGEGARGVRMKNPGDFSVAGI